MKRNVAGAALLALLTFALAACNSDDLPPGSSYATLQGIVLDASTNAPVSGAVVTVDTVLNATSDKDGKFTIDKIPAGIVDYTVQAKGYKNLTSTGNAEPSKPFSLNVSLTPGPPSP